VTETVTYAHIHTHKQNSHSKWMHTSELQVHTCMHTHTTQQDSHR